VTPEAAGLHVPAWIAADTMCYAGGNPTVSTRPNRTPDNTVGVAQATQAPHREHTGGPAGVLARGVVKRSATAAFKRMRKMWRKMWRKMCTKTWKLVPPCSSHRMVRCQWQVLKLDLCNFPFVLQRSMYSSFDVLAQFVTALKYAHSADRHLSE
jgi:hypothetical protein